MLSFDWRMEVKSDLFTVYSAKKFPGLAESTNLSRTVAEQGCRVRIRRDVPDEKKRREEWRLRRGVQKMSTAGKVARSSKNPIVSALALVAMAVMGEDRSIKIHKTSSTRVRATKDLRPRQIPFLMGSI